MLFNRKINSKWPLFVSLRSKDQIRSLKVGVVSSSGQESPWRPQFKNLLTIDFNGRYLTYLGDLLGETS